jgi:hypothetical protein
MQRPILLTYYFVRDKFNGQELSVRKRFCFAYLQWAAECDKNLKETVVELAKEWRKVEAKVGQKRTKLEKIARRFFYDIAKQKRRGASREAASEFARKQFENKTGVHSPEYAERRRQQCIENRRKQAEQDLGQAMWWVITAPDGTEFAIRSLAKWARENGVNKDLLQQTSGTIGKTVNGYRCRKFNPEIDKMP